MDEFIDFKKLKECGVSKADYIRALKVIGTCKEDRLMYILEALMGAGFPLPDTASLETIRMRKRTVAKTNRSERRTSEEKMLKTDDEVALALREAYRKGISLSAIGEECDTNRVCLYQYMTGQRRLMSDKLRNLVLDAVARIMKECDEK